MCGIVGFVDFSGDTCSDILWRMARSLNHRGPDDEGIMLHDLDSCRVGLGHKRLAIIELSAGGHQPMVDDNLCIVFNGEIYNYKEIRNELIASGTKFVGHSDTEVILRAYREWGDRAVHRFLGMFAFVIFDSKANELKAFVDRAGVKPLYYYKTSDLLLFASELKALHQHPRFQKIIARPSLVKYFQNVHQGYVPAPYTIFENTFKLEQGTSLKLNFRSRHCSVERYWSVEECYTAPALDIDYVEAKDHLASLLQSSFNYRMVSDVPVGVFLSGGYDSAAVTALLQKGRSDRLKTFTIGFDEGTNEAPHARAVAEFLGTDHVEYVCTASDVKRIVPDLPRYFDEPFADSSAIPTILVSRLAREHVKVALSADAGDEIFAGYLSYVSLARNMRLINTIPAMFKGRVSKLLTRFAEIIPRANLELRHRFSTIADSMDEDPFREAAHLFKGMNSLPEDFRSQLFAFQALPDEGYFERFPQFKHPLEAALALDFKFYLQNDILTKVDRATMSASLEGREPFLDHRIIEFAARLPMDFKLNGLFGKKILKDIVHDHIPFALMNRPKTGFALPIYTWLRHDLRFLIDEYLNERALAESGFFHLPFVNHQVQLFKAGKMHYKPFIWKLLMFQMWYRKWA